MPSDSAPRALAHTRARARTLACPPRCAGMARAKYHRHARSASCCCENMRMRGGGGDCRQILPRAHTHRCAHVARQPASTLAYLGVSRGYRASERRVGTAKSPSIQYISASAYRPNCLSMKVRCNIPNIHSSRTRSNARCAHTGGIVHSLAGCSAGDKLHSALVDTRVG